MKRHEEDDLQMACVRWFSYQHPRLAPLLHHSPNGGYRNAREAARFKAMGVRAGFPDLVLLVPTSSHPFLCIEMKTPKGRLSGHQEAYRDAVTAAGGVYVVVRDFDGFMQVVGSYLEGAI